MASPALRPRNGRRRISLAKLTQTAYHMCGTLITPIVPAPVSVALYTFSTIKEQLRWRADEKISFNTSGRLFNDSSCFVFLKYRPYKSCQFTSYRHRHFTRHLSAISKVPIAFSKPLSSSISNIYRPLRLTVSSFPQGFAYVTRVPILPGNFNQDPPYPFIASPSY